jgi:hypothetical protein
MAWPAYLTQLMIWRLGGLALGRMSASGRYFRESAPSTRRIPEEENLQARAWLPNSSCAVMLGKEIASKRGRSCGDSQSFYGSWIITLPVIISLPIIIYRSRQQNLPIGHAAVIHEGRLIDVDADIAH